MSRKPPHDENAEAAVLGSMLLTAEAVRTGLDLCAAADFYRPEHAEIFSAIGAVYAEGHAVDLVTVGAVLAQRGSRVDRAALVRVQVQTPASMNADSYAHVVAERARARRAIELGEALSAAGFANDADEAVRLAATGSEILSGPLGDVDSSELDDIAALADRDDEDPAKPWVMPGLFRLGETLIVTGFEGLGKSTFLRQIAVCVASGLHPFTGHTGGMEQPRRVLIVDLQEDEIDLAHELRTLRRVAGGAYRNGMLHAACRPQGVNLLEPRDLRWFEALLVKHRPELVVMGPLVRLYRSTGGRSRYDEDLVDELTDKLDQLRIRYGFALILEGHAGNDRSTDEGWRVRGSSVWRSWPRFGLGLEKIDVPQGREAKVHWWRGGGHAGREWPRRFIGPAAWPWVLDGADYERLLMVLGQQHFGFQEELL